MMLNPLTSGKYQTLQSPSSHVFFWGWSEFQKKNCSNCYAQVSKSNAIGVPGFVAKPGGGGRPVPSRHISQLQQQRRLLWLPGALLSSVIDAFRKVFAFLHFRFRFFCPMQPLPPEPILPKEALTPCWSILEFWKIKLETSNLTNWLFSLQKSISKCFFLSTQALKIQFEIV